MDIVSGFFKGQGDSATDAIVGDTDELSEQLFKLCKTGKDEPQIGEDLIDKGADFDWDGPEGKTPLHVACEKGLIGLCKLFVAKGSDLLLRDEADKTAVYYALKQDREPKIAEILCDALTVQLEQRDDEKTNLEQELEDIMSEKVTAEQAMLRKVTELEDRLRELGDGGGGRGGRGGRRDHDHDDEEFERLRDENRRLADDLDALKDELRDAKKAARSSGGRDDDGGDNGKEVSRLKDKLAKVRADREEMQRQIDDMRDQLERAEERGSKGGRGNNDEDELADLQRRIEELETDLDQERTRSEKYKSKCDKLSQDREDRDSRDRQDNSRLEEEAERLEKKASKLERDVERMHKEKQRLEDEIRDLEDSALDAHTRKQAAERDHEEEDKVRDELDRLKEDKRRAEQDLDDLQADVDKAQDQYDRLQSDIKELQAEKAETAELSGDVSALKKERRDCEADLKALEKDIKVAQDKLADLNDDIKDAEDKLLTLKDQQAEAEDKADAAKKDLADAEAKLDKIEREYANKESDLQDLQADLRSRRQDVGAREDPVRRDPDPQPERGRRPGRGGDRYNSPPRREPSVSPPPRGYENRYDGDDAPDDTLWDDIRDDRDDAYTGAAVGAPAEGRRGRDDDRDDTPGAGSGGSSYRGLKGNLISQLDGPRDSAIISIQIVGHAFAGGFLMANVERDHHIPHDLKCAWFRVVDGEEELIDGTMDSMEFQPTADDVGYTVRFVCNAANREDDVPEEDLVVEVPKIHPKGAADTGDTGGSGRGVRDAPRGDRGRDDRDAHDDVPSGDIYIEQSTPVHTGTLTLRGVPAATTVTWSRSEGDQWAPIPGEKGVTYRPTVDDVSCDIRAVCPSGDAIVGPIQIDPRTRESVSQHLSKKEATFSVREKHSGKMRTILVLGEQVKFREKRSTLAKQGYHAGLKVQLAPSNDTEFVLRFTDSLSFVLVAASREERDVIALTVRSFALMFQKRGGRR